MKTTNKKEIVTLLIDGNTRTFYYEDEWHENHADSSPNGQGYVGIKEINKDGKAEGLYVNTLYSNFTQCNDQAYDSNRIIRIGFHKDGKMDGPLYTFSDNKLVKVTKFKDGGFSDEYEQGDPEFEAYQKMAPNCREAFDIFMKVRKAVFAGENNQKQNLAPNKLATLRKNVAHNVDKALGTHLEEKKLPKPIKNIEKALSGILFGRVNE